MPDQISDQARREVNDALISAGSTAVGQLVDTANSSKFKRDEARKKREEGGGRRKSARRRKRRSLRFVLAPLIALDLISWDADHKKGAFSFFFLFSPISVSTLNN